MDVAVSDDNNNNNKTQRSLKKKSSQIMLFMVDIPQQTMIQAIDCQISHAMEIYVVR